MLEAVYIQNQVDLKEHNGEIYMRFDTDLKSVSKVRVHERPVEVDDIPIILETESDPTHQPTFYTDQGGFTVEKRIKVPKIKYEGNK